MDMVIVKTKNGYGEKLWSLSTRWRLFF